MTKTLTIGLVLAASVALAPATHANEGINTGPLGGAERVELADVMVGNTLAAESQQAEGLFRGDHRRSAAFEEMVRGEVEKRLEAAGLVGNDARPFDLSLDYFGGWFRADGCEGHAQFLLEVRVGEPDAEFNRVERTVLGVADDQNLEQVLLRSTLAVIDEMLQQWRWGQEAEDAKAAKKP